MDRSPSFPGARDLGDGSGTPETAVTPKIVRARIARLLVETEHCRFILPQLLGTLNDHGVAAFGIALERGMYVQTIAFDTAELADKAQLAILRGVLRLKNVRAARFAAPDPSHQPRDKPFGLR